MRNKKNIVISGASRGIGNAIARLFASHGWSVFTAARTKKYLNQMQQDWKLQFPTSNLFTINADLSTKVGAEKLTSFVQTHCHQIDILVNNVGQFAPGGLLDGEKDQLEYFLQTNVLSAHYLTRGLSTLLSNAPQAHLFTIGSVAANSWPLEMAAYALSKATLHAWHKGISQELQPFGIKATLIIPDATYTSSWDGIDIDPKTLLSAEAVAELVWKYKNSEKREVVINLSDDVQSSDKLN